MSKRDAIKRLLSRGTWVSGRRLEAVAGWRFGGRIHELRRRGFDHEVKRAKSGETFYRRVR